jgi:hypothetical protein
MPYAVVTNARSALEQTTLG